MWGTVGMTRTTREAMSGGGGGRKEGTGIRVHDEPVRIVAAHGVLVLGMVGMVMGR